MPLPNRYVFGHLCGEKTYSSFGLALFSSPVTFIKSMENLIKVVSRHFTYYIHSLYFFIAPDPHPHSPSSSLLSYRSVPSWHSRMVKLCCRLCSLFFTCESLLLLLFLSNNFFLLSFSRFATLFPSTLLIRLSFYVHTLQTFINKRWHSHTHSPLKQLIYIFLYAKLMLSYQLIAWVCVCGVCLWCKNNWMGNLFTSHISCSFDALRNTL